MSLTNIADKRLEIFKHFDKMDNPIVSVTTELKINKNSLNNTTLMACILYGINEIDNFKLRIVNNRFCLFNDNPIIGYKNVGLGYTVHTRDKINTFKFAVANYNEWFDLQEIEIKNSLKSAFRRDTFYCEGGNRKDLIYISCVPKTNFTSVQQPFNRATCDIPSIIVGSVQDGKLSISVSAHHGLVDGYHINLFLTNLTKLINNLTK